VELSAWRGMSRVSVEEPLGWVVRAGFRNAVGVLLPRNLQPVSNVEIGLFEVSYVDAEFLVRAADYWPEQRGGAP
jgi:hypothetical protein